MKKKSIILMAVITIILGGCSNSSTSNTTPNNGTNEGSVNTDKSETDKTDSNTSKNETTTIVPSNISSIASIEELEAVAVKDAENTVAKVEAEAEKIKVDIDTYEKYAASVDRVEAFYALSVTESEQLAIRLREYGLRYAQLVVNSDVDFDDKYDNFDGIHDTIYDDAADEMYNIYDDVLEDIYDVFYDGIIEDAYDMVEYSDWADARSTEYDMWSDSRSDVYEHYSDVRSDLYEFYSDLRSEAYAEDAEALQIKLDDFQKDVEKFKN